MSDYVWLLRTPTAASATTCRTTELLLLPPPPLVGLVGLVVHFFKPLSHYEETSTNIQDAQHQHWNVNSHLINNKLRPENPEIGRNTMKYTMKYHCRVCRDQVANTLRPVSAGSVLYQGLHLGFVAIDIREKAERTEPKNSEKRSQKFGVSILLEYVKLRKLSRTR